jgi:murein DD-endopeptidase MepM/ murein hydrolase activator NlpD
MTALAAALLVMTACVTTARSQTVSRTADGFDLPVAPPDAAGFYKSRGFRSGGHMGEDWVTDGGSARGYGRPVYSIGNGIVVLARDVHVAWGNVVIVRHAWIENRQLRFADSLYAHLERITVREGQQVSRKQQVGTVGNNRGMYPPHLHFEIHKDLSIGVNHSQGTRDLRSYWLPTEFIMARRHLGGGGRFVPTPSASFILPSVEHPWSFRKPFQKKGTGSSAKGRSHSTPKASSHQPSGSYRINRYTDP